MLFNKGDRIVFIGDSITDCGRARPVGEGFRGGLGTGYVNNIATLLGSMYPEMPVRIMNTGISGNRIEDLDGRWQEDVLDLTPDWVIVLIGINDVWRQYDCPMQTELHNTPERYGEIYRSLIEKTLPRVKGMVLMTPFFIESNRQDIMRARMDEYGEVVKRLASEYKLPLVDTQAAWDALLQHAFSANIAGDRVHPNSMGSMYLAKVFLKAIGFDR